MSRLFWVIIGSLLSVLGIVVPVLWDLYSNNRLLELRLVNSISLLTTDIGLDNIKITFGDREIKNVSRADFALVNAGRVPIGIGDVIDYPRVEFPGSDEILFTRVNRTDPSYMDVNLDSGKNEITIRFKLLNPTDFIDFSVFTAGSELKLPEVKARIADLKEVDFVDERVTEVTTRATPSFAIYIVGAVTLFALVVVLGLAPEMSVQRKIRDRLRREPELLDSLNSLQEVDTFLDKEAPYLSGSERANIRRAGVAEDGFKKIESINAIKKEILGITSTSGAFYVFLVIGFAGMIYIVSELVHIDAIAQTFRSLRNVLA